MQSKGHVMAVSSGTSNPEFISYPRVLNLEDIPEIQEQYVYIVRGYEEAGLCVLINRHKGDVAIRAADWDANIIDLSEKGKQQDYFQKFIADNSLNIVNFLIAAKIQKVLLYITVEQEELILTDARISLDKFVGPGMLRDLFGKFIHTQDVIEIATLDDNLFKSIQEGRGKYDCDLMLKTSRFKTIIRDSEMLPLYARVKRNAKLTPKKIT